VGPFSLRDYPWLEVPYQVIGNLHSGGQAVIRKAAQMGLTEMAINYAFYRIDTSGARIFYALPPGLNMVGDFAHDRIDPAIGYSPHLRDLEGSTDNVGLKTFKRGALYLRGTSVPAGRPDKAPQLSSIPADVAIIDELDRVPPAAIPLIEDRLGDSHLDIMLLLSTPTFPGTGIDEYYAKSDQREPSILCPGCGERSWAEWANVRQVDSGICFCCSHCGKPVDLLHTWEEKRIVFEARNPDSKVPGFWIPRLVSPRASLQELWTRCHSTDPDTVLAFRNNDMGHAYEPVGSKLTATLIRACASDPSYVAFPDRSGWSAMGVDVGNDLNVWIMEAAEDGKHRAVYIDAVQEWEQLDRLIVRYGIEKVMSNR